jgi:putative DNA primase/helicase
MTRYQCTHCDIESSNPKDLLDCKKRRHEILDFPEPDEKKHTEYAKEIMKDITFKTICDTQEILYYENGVYRTGAVTIINSECEQRIPNCTSYMRREVFKTIQASTYVERNQFDGDPTVLNLKNGLLNIDTNDFRSHTPHYLSRIQLPVNYNRDAGPVKFIEFMMDALPDTKDRNLVIEEFSSILLRDGIRLEKVFMYVGYGANGKSTFLSVIETLIGDENTSHVSIQDLISARFARAQLDGKMANIFADISNDELTKLGALKAIISGDTISVEKKGKDHFNMKNHAKMFYSCNQLPEISEDTDAVFRRFNITEWNQQFLGDKDNKNLLNELTTEDELSGILNLLIHKARQILTRQKLSYEESTEELRMEWKERANPIQRFSKEKLREAKTSVVAKSEVYAEYVDWCKSHQVNPKNESQFTKKLKSLGFRDDTQRIRNGILDPKGKTTRIWVTVTLVTSLHSTLLGKQIEKNSISIVDKDIRNGATDVTKKMFVCIDCDAGPFGIEAVGTCGVKIREFHEKQGHTIRSYSWDDDK